MCSFISLALISVRKICNINPTKVLKWEEFTSNRTTLVRRPICPLFYCFGSAVNSRFPKAMCIQNLLRKQNNCPSFNFGYKSTSSFHVCVNLRGPQAVWHVIESFYSCFFTHTAWM